MAVEDSIAQALTDVVAQAAVAEAEADEPAPAVAAVNPPAVLPDRPETATAEAEVEAEVIAELAQTVAANVDAASELIAETTEAEAPEAAAQVAAASPLAGIKPKARPDSLVVLASLPGADADTTAEAAPAAIARTVAEAADDPDVVTRLSTSSGRHWGINVGRFNSRYAAEKMLLQTALTEVNTLDGTLRKVVQGNAGFDANFMGLTRETADLACRRLQVRQVQCFMIGPS